MIDIDPSVSILMCVRNERREFLDAALRSLAAQDFSDFEIVLIDDGSTADDTLQNLARWARHEKRIRLFVECSHGLTGSLNIGLKHCRAPLVARRDSDDWSAGHRLATQVAFMEAHPEVGLLGSQVMIHTESGVDLWQSSFPERDEDIVAAFPRLNRFCHGATMFGRELVCRAGGYRESLPCSQDYDLFWRLAERTHTVNLAQALYHPRRTASSVSAARAADQARAALLTRIVARQRKTGAEVIGDAEEEARRTVQSSNLQQVAGRKRADNLLLAGDFLAAVQAFMRLVMHILCTRVPTPPPHAASCS